MAEKMDPTKKLAENEIEVKTVDEAAEKIAEIQKDSSVNKPTEKEINEATKIFNEQAAEFNGKRFEIGAPEKGDKYLDFVILFMDKYVYWTKQGWLGVIKMTEELEQFKKDKKEGEPFSLGYQALEFLFYALTNPGGTGLKSAKDLESVAEIYGEIIEDSGKVLEQARKDLKEIQFLQDQVTAMQQGFYLEREDGVAKEEEDQGFASPSADDLLKKEK